MERSFPSKRQMLHRGITTSFRKRPSRIFLSEALGNREGVDLNFSPPDAVGDGKGVDSTVFWGGVHNVRSLERNMEVFSGLSPVYCVLRGS